VLLHAPESGYAATRAEAVLREAERTLIALERIVDERLSEAAAPVEIVLVDGLPPDWGDRNGETHGTQDRIPVAVAPDQPTAGLGRPLARLLLRSAFDSPALEDSFVEAGIAGVAAASSGSGPAIEDCDAWVRSEVANGRPVSVVNDEISSEIDPRAATSFVAFLRAHHGDDALPEFIRGYDDARRDDAARTAFGQPLGVLEEEWLVGLQRGGQHGGLRSLVGELRPLIRPYRWRFAEALGYTFVGLISSLGPPLAAKYLIDHVIPSDKVRDLLVFLAVLCAAYLIDAGVELRKAYINGWINQRVVIALQDNVFIRLQRLSHSFHERSKVGDLMSRLTDDVFVVQQGVNLALGTGIGLLFQVVASAVTLVLLSALLGALVLVVVPLFMLSYIVVAVRLGKATYEQQERIGAAAATAQEALSAHALVKALGLEERMRDRYSERLERIFKAHLRVTVLMAGFTASIGLATMVGQLVVLGVGGYLAMNGDMSIGTLVAFVALLPGVFAPIAALSEIGQAVQMAGGSLARLREVSEAPIEIEDREEAREARPLENAIAFEGVSFGYRPDRPVLSDFDLRIGAGEHVAIVGPSGSGKTTITNLALRFYDPTAGRVTYDGADLRELSLSSLRGQVGIVFQDTFVFDSTLRENIAIARPDATDSEIMAAAEGARLGEFVAGLPNGFETVLGERGARMSGGQRQRLAIARAVLRNPSVLILDEATSALDPQTEREIIATLDELGRGRTTITITHRLALAAGADRIVVLDAGRLSEEGSHDELLAAGGLYRRLYEEQTGGRAGAAPAPDPLSLARVGLFAHARADTLESVAARLRRERFPAGTDVVRQGDLGDRLYVIESGDLHVLVEDGAGARRVNTLYPGDWFGELALTSDAPRSATVRAATDADLYALRREDFNALLGSDAGLAAAVEDAFEERRAAYAFAADRA
jgi:ABC-type multidrug transport system fused ATPase/permease subunit